MDYQQSMEFLESTKKYGSQLGLKSIQNLMALLGDVQDRVPIIHIGGTNGKGSVGAMLSSVFQKAGYTVGHFSTPDVFSYEEEFRMNGIPVSKERLAQLFTKVAACCRDLVEGGEPHPTRFEVETAAAFLWFYEEKCDAAIVEVGMGGETDATNLIRKPVLSILTSVGMDHMGFLGNCLSDIAAVKAGIIKPGCPVVAMEQEREVMEVFQSRCEQTGSCLIWSGMKPVQNVRIEDARAVFSWRKANTEAVCFGERKENRLCIPDIRLGLTGSYQLQNAACVLEALEVLKDRYPDISAEAIRKGLADVRWPGRFERIGQTPDVYLDGAHNEDAVLKLRETIDRCLPGKRVLYIMGVLADKDYERMIRLMFRSGDRVYTLTPDNPRALDGKTLEKLLLEHKINASYCETAANAVSYAMREAGRNDVILAFGSLSYLRTVKKAYRQFCRDTEKER